MSIQEVPTEELARFLYRYHQVLAPYLHCQNRSHTEPWTEIGDGERRQLIAAAKMALLELQAEVHEEEDRSRYFAKPGTAEWGC
jgi:hypothetical protein